MIVNSMYRYLYRTPIDWRVVDASTEAARLHVKYLGWYSSCVSGTAKKLDGEDSHCRAFNDTTLRREDSD